MDSEVREPEFYIDSQSRKFLAAFNKFQDLAIRYDNNDEPVITYAL